MFNLRHKWNDTDTIHYIILRSGVGRISKSRVTYMNYKQNRKESNNNILQRNNSSIIEHNVCIKAQGHYYFILKFDNEDGRIVCDTPINILRIRHYF